MFGMGTGVSPPLSPPETDFPIWLRYNPDGRRRFIESKRAVAHPAEFMVKPHGHLVPVSFAPRDASTPGLSTSWSTRGLQGPCGPGMPYLGVGFPLICFQRLSLPYLATRHCVWRHNRNTSGTSDPVLSY